VALNKKITELSLLTAVGIIFFTVETVLPNPVPFFRLGLANIVTIIVIKRWGVMNAVLVLFLRIILGSLVTGKIFTPLFIMSVAGGSASLVIMFLLIKYFPEKVSLVGVSVAGASVHNIVQLYIANCLFIKSVYIISILPVFLFTSVFSGALVGILTIYSLRIIGQKIKNY